MDKLTHAITELALDTENAEKNYNLGILYEEIGQTASAINFFYRAAERSKNKELIYECLCKAAICYEKQGNRQLTVRRVLQHAIHTRPKRPEAYYLLTKILEKTSQYNDCYTFASIALQICDFDAAPLRSDVGYPGMYALIFQKAVSGWYWGKNEESRSLFVELSTKYKNEMDSIHTAAVQNNLNNLIAGFNKNITSTIVEKNKKKTIVDYFAYYDDTCKELLELRVNLLKDHVDYFVICEANKTQSGIPLELKLRQRIEEYNLPADKIIVVELDIPESEDLVILDIDRHNSGENSSNINSVRARVRERMQKDGIMQVLDRFDDDTLIIHSDCDEIIDPKSIKFVTDMALTVPKNVIKVPLIWLEGRADLRVYDTISNTPKAWNLSMFVCTKRQLIMTNPINIRCNYNNPFPIVWCTENGKYVDDMGWHFQWMGGSEKRKNKRDAFCHYEDNYDFLQSKGYNNKEAVELIEAKPKEGMLPPSLEKDTVLKKYDTKNLPVKIFELPRVKQFLFSE